MGYYTELNTLLRPLKDFDFKSLVVGNTYTVVLERERAFPLRIAVLLIDSDWKFYGYCQALETKLKDKKTTITFEMLTIFSPPEQLFYKQIHNLRESDSGAGFGAETSEKTAGCLCQHYPAYALPVFLACGKNTIKEAKETILIGKTLETKWKAAETEVLKLHSYTNPAILAIPLIHVTKKYADWLLSELK